MKVAFLFNQKPEPNSDEASSSKISPDEFAEWDNPETIRAVSNALREHHEVVDIDCHPDKIKNVIDALHQFAPDICFNIVEGAGAMSREAQIPALLDLLGLPHTASDATTLAITHDKARTKEILAYHQIRTAAFQVIERIDDQTDFTGILCTFPLIVKPLHEGSSKGIFERSVVETRSELIEQIQEVIHRYKQPAIVEEFLPGREFTVGVLGNGAQAEILPIVEIRFDALPKHSKGIYSFEAKWEWDTKDSPVEVFECPAKLSKDEEDDIRQQVLKAYRTLRCRDWARIDVRFDKNGKATIIEINPLPGILPDPNEHSCLPLAARTAGLEYNALIQRVLSEATRRYGLVE
ncbi:MAG: ATP-grasp domain-containing protein [Chloroherpetonaceae bacterium]|nr:ATP-grasp domain-containing protein [Chloroherpetonaceae bacterium]